MNYKTVTIVVFSLAFILRLIIICYSIWHDSNFVVKYTDIDYSVFTDAARFVTEGQSPYMRSTYRYIPLLAYILTPNIYLHECFGKVLFSLLDLLAGYIIFALLRLQHLSVEKSLIYTSLCYLFNPIVFNISTRGNADQLVVSLVLASLYCLFKKRVSLAAFWFGLSVHTKIYPIIYAPAFYLFLDKYDYEGHERPEKRSLKQKIFDFFSPTRLKFTLISAFTFLGLTGLFYLIYGWEFLYETYLYHYIRSDNRHNFSVYFYQIYLNSVMNKKGILSQLAFLPQFSAILVMGMKFYKNILFTLFVQTVAFVAFNKVCTVQYFIWYLGLLAFALATSRISLKKGIFMTLLWIGGQGLWLNYAYQLEFLGENSFFRVWLSGIFFFIVNLFILIQFLLNYEYQPIFENGKINKIKEKKE